MFFPVAGTLPGCVNDRDLLSGSVASLNHRLMTLYPFRGNSLLSPLVWYDEAMTPGFFVAPMLPLSSE